ncbi:MAG: radical SAM protein, partial [Propionibacteriaceae bacterium]|nr:radical SAM protein [Propionibacteriaceae bacterium]
MTAPRGRKPPRHWLDMTPAEREAAVAELGLPRFRADQVTRQLLVRHELDPQQWSDLPKAARAALAEAFLPELLAKVRQLAADGGRTVKTLWRLHDGALIESVLMAYRSRVTVCVSSQAGCGMACPFCATGQGGLRRNLSTAEILWQVVDAARWPGGRLSNVVFMGMGEPLANYDRLLPALRAINSDLGVSARQVTVSTVGLAPQIDRLAAEGLPVTLAISLHAPD